MADILIKNMEMPKYCRGCPFEVSSIYGQKCRITRKFTRLNDNEDGMKRHISCPLVALQEHGRLIDADELEGILDEVNGYGGASEITYKKMIEILHDETLAPVILEANNGTDN